MLHTGPWYADFTNSKVANIIPSNLSWQKKKKFLDEVKFYCGMSHSCSKFVLTKKNKAMYIGRRDKQYTGGHHSGERIAAKVHQNGFYCPTLFSDAKKIVESCEQCERSGNISKKHEIPLNNLLEVKLFDVWGIYLMGPFPSSYSNQYILVVIDYVPKWVEEIPSPTNDAKVVVGFLKQNIFSRFRVP